VRRLWDALVPHSSGGYLLNFLGDDNPEAIRGAFGSNHARLVELKTKYDPTNFFSLNQNVLSRPRDSRSLREGAATAGGGRKAAAHEASAPAPVHRQS
jgi:hypothetical protein